MFKAASKLLSDETSFTLVQDWVTLLKHVKKTIGKLFSNDTFTLVQDWVTLLKHVKKSK